VLGCAVKLLELALTTEKLVRRLNGFDKYGL